jgi:site-specific recombinase XerD
MRLAYRKVRDCAHLGGTHVLRHTAATRLLQHGASLKEIADVLGHRSLDTTTIYAKVDLPGLIDVALPWPEVRP